MAITGANASAFTVISPSMVPANVPLAGAPVVIQFQSSVVGISTAQLRIVTADSTGVPLPDTILVNLTGRRGKSSFQLLEQIFDFGILPPNTPMQATFQWMRNNGTEPLDWSIPLDSDPDFSVINTQPAPVLDAAPGQSPRFIVVIQPNEVLSITVRFNGREAGQTIRSFKFSPVSKTCNVFQTFECTAVTAQNPPNITVRKVVQGAEIPIGNEVYFGEFDCPNKNPPYKDTTLKIYNSGQVPLIVREARFSHPDFQLLSPPLTPQRDSIVVPFNTTRDITIRYTPRTPSVLDIDATLQLFSNASNTSMTGSTTVTLRVRKDSINLSVSRLNVDFGAVTRGGTVPAQTLVIRNTGTLGQAILPLADPNFIATFSPQIVQAGDSVVVTLRAVNTSQAGVVSGTWLLQDNCDRITQIALRLTVNRPNPTIGIAVPVSFGRLLCATDTVLTLPITNTGDNANDLDITDMRIVGQNSAFVLVQPPTPTTPFSIQSGQSRSIQIRFRPSGSGTFTDTLRIVSNAEGTPIFNAVLTGSKDFVSFRLSQTSVSFVNLLPNEATTETITVFNTGTVPITWGAGSFKTAGQFSLEFDPLVTPVGGSSQVKVGFRGGAVDISTRDSLFGVCGQIQTIAVSATILPPYISATPAVSFGTLTCETTSNASFSITNTGGQDLVISTITSSSPLFQLQLPTQTIRLARGITTTIPVVFQPLPTTLGATNATITITSNAANGVTTTTLSAIKNVLDFEFLDLTATDSRNRIYRFLGTVPPNTPITTTVRIRNIGNQPITWGAPFYSPDSLFVIESIAQNPTQPNAITTMTLRYRGSPCPGTFITASPLEVLRNYGFSCSNPPALVTLSAQTLPATARLWTDSISAGISDTVLLPIRLRNPQYLREAGVTGFSFVLRYDFSTLVPLAADKGTIVGQSRLQPMTLMLPTPIPSDSILGHVRFQATLGSTSGTRIFIDSLRAIGTSGASCIIFDNTGLQGNFTLQRICTEGDMRLVTAASVRTTLAQSKPNPASNLVTFDFSLLERGMTTISVYSIMGEEVKRIVAERLEPGTYSLDVDISQLPSGVYFYVLQTPTDRKARRMEIMR